MFSLLRKWRNWMKTRRGRPVLSLESDGFACTWRGKTTKVSWSEVLEIFAFKRDLWTYDMICIGFRVSEDGNYYEIDEEMPGYNAVVAAMENAFPGIVKREAWFHSVAFPAFATNLKTLWGAEKMRVIWQIQR